jgi:hypothetical protein
MGSFCFADLGKRRGVLLLGAAALSVAFFGACGGGDQSGLSAGGGSGPKNGGADASSSNGTGGAGAKSHVCAPGTTLECVGPGACRGGQACNQDGTGYGVCDCGLRGTGGGRDASDDAPTSNRL